MKKYLLVTDASAARVSELTGLDAHQTHLGALVKRAPEINLEAELDKLDRIMHPNNLRCTCGKFAVLHSPRCPFTYITT